MTIADAFVDARPLLLVSDFDGTLSPIMLDPWGARINSVAQRALRRLTSVDGVHVALLSGRLVLDLAGRARIGGATYMGNFGMERGVLGRHGRAAGMRVDGVAVAPALVALADRLAREVPLRVMQSWLVVEHKPASVAFHFRAAPDLEAAALDVRRAVDAVDPGEDLERYPGRRVLELRPRGAPNKGDAFRSMLAEYQPRAALMLGDDISDVPAFLALREARDAGTIQGLAVGVRARPEVPHSVTESADVMLDSVEDAARFLSRLAERVRGRA